MAPSGRSNGPIQRPSAADQDQGSRWIERLSELRQRPVADCIEHQIVADVAVREIIPPMVDHLVGADGADQLHVFGTADASHLCAERLRDLHGETAEAWICP